MNLQSFWNILFAAVVSTTVSSQAVQYIKEHFKFKNCCAFGICSLVIGFFFCLAFCNGTILESLWCGFLSVVGADQLYKSLEGKYGFKSFLDIVTPTDNGSAGSNISDEPK